MGHLLTAEQDLNSDLSISKNGILTHSGPPLPQVTAGKPGLLLSQGISGSIPLEAENTESLSHTYF